MNMACSCRMIALRIFARSLAQVHAPTTQYARSTWPANRSRLPNRNISITHNYRQAHTLAESSDTAAEGQEAQKLPPEDQRKPQPEESLQSSSSRASESSGEEDRLFKITKRSKNAFRKATRYSQQSVPSLSSESQGHSEEKPDKDQQSRTSTEELKTSTEELKTSTEESTEQPKKIKKLREKKRQKRAEMRAERSEEQASKVKDKEERVDNSPEEPKTSAEESTEQPKKNKKLREKKRPNRAEKWAEEGTERSEHQAAKVKDKKERDDNRPMWLKQKEALKKKFPEGWRPPKRLSPDALDGIRVLHRQFPDMYTTAALAEKFEVSPEAIRRILKAKWEPSAEEEESRQTRWFKRGVSVWQRYAELGMRPPKKWLEAGVQAGYEEPSRKEQQSEKEDVAGGMDPETAVRLQAQMKLSKSLV
ncbi:hypothetical protein KVR01_005881 [Diaporthe batatas]|uniref:uncharacterized protein n=1 Tax=Diaporthe batatas TaxID=748121 RepID=UPI001D04D0E4|nr:uncharacterized protein KVR01_005881 [Diaporthe batatas]KAG8163963.1 hypothetical protein KVR01_005881 [Diaporthe batatas]